MSGVSGVKLGEKAPDVRLQGMGGEVGLSQVLAGRPAVVYFYPRDETAGCTAEACSFRDAYEQFIDAGALVVGISSDSADAHERFRQKHRLPFELLSDPDGSAGRAFGVKKTFGLLAGRVTFVLDREGVVRLRFDSQLRVHEHVARALATLEQLKASTPSGEAPAAKSNAVASPALAASVP